MSELPHDANTTIDQPGDGPVATLSAQFEAAWRKALRGGTQPSIDGYLAQVPETDRTALNDELTRIDAEYRRKHAQAVSIAGAAVLNSVKAIPSTDEPDSATFVQSDVDPDATP